MDDAGRASTVALGVGAVALVAAGVGVLLRRTRGMPAGRRARAMTRLAAEAAWGVLPSRGFVVAAAAGLLAFAVTLAAGLVVTVLVVRAIPPEVPHPTEAYEGFGDAMLALIRFYIGAGLSVVVAAVVGLVAAMRVASRWGRGGAAPSASAK